MALTADACLYPRWRLKAEVLWPSRSMAQSEKLARAALNGGLIDQGNAKAAADGFTGDAKDEAARWYAGYLAAQGRLDQMIALPGAVDVRDQGSSKYDPDQRDLMLRLRDEMLAGYDGLVGAAAGDDGSFAVIQSLR